MAVNRLLASGRRHARQFLPDLEGRFRPTLQPTFQTYTLEALAFCRADSRREERPMPVQRLKDFLDKNDIQYILISHSRAYTAAAIGAITHIPGKLIAKTVIVKLDGKLAMVVVPGSRHVNLAALKAALHADSALLVSEPEFADRFPDCEVG